MGYTEKHFELGSITMAYVNDGSKSCVRCGQMIANVFTVVKTGETYGSECIKHVTGLNPKYIEQEIKRAEYLEKNKDEINARIAEEERLREERQKKIEKITKQNKWLIDLMEYQENRFYNSFANTLKEKTLDDLTDKQFNIVWDFLAGFNLKQLKDFCKYLEIKLKAKAKKDDIIETILEKF